MHIGSATLKALEAFPSQLEDHYAAIPVEFRHWAPDSWEGIPSEAFTAIEQICHVRDIEIEGYQIRFRRTLEEHNPLLASIDSESIAKARSYRSQDVSEVFACLKQARKNSILLLCDLSAEQWEREAFFEGYGPVTLRALVHYLCSHDQQHLSGLQWLLGKIEGSRSGPR